MFAFTNSAHLIGINATSVEVECDTSSRGLPSFSIVGLGDSAIKESKDRVKSALKNLGYNIFARPITINLAPADLKKEGSHFDLPIAISILKSLEIIETSLDKYLIIGELALDGRLRGVTGVLSIVEYAKENNIPNIILPMENVDEALLIPDINIYGFDNLGTVISFLRGDEKFLPLKQENCLNYEDVEYGLDFIDVKGQYLARRAVEIAASGMHNFIMIGTPGSGKTMIAKRIPSILPPMKLLEALETTKIHSVAGLIRENGKLIIQRPFVSPHHTASNIAIIGGGSKAMPGHVSLASGGVLFLDEMLEFSRNVLEVLRQPLEDKEVTIARAGKTVTYPAKFMLVGAMNPCPCGYLGDKKKACTCTQTMIDRYKSKLSGPMLDRIDLISSVETVEYSDLMDLKDGESSKDIRKRVIEAHNIQAERFKNENILFNSQMNERLVKKYCILDEKARDVLENIMAKYSISARAYSKILKTSRTIADMGECDKILSNHILEAFQMKIPDQVD